MTESQHPVTRSAELPRHGLAPGGPAGTDGEDQIALYQERARQAEARSKRFNRWLWMLVVGTLLLSPLVTVGTAIALAHLGISNLWSLGGVVPGNGLVIFLAVHCKHNADHERDKAERLHQNAERRGEVRLAGWNFDRVRELTFSMEFESDRATPPQSARQLELDYRGPYN